MSLAGWFVDVCSGFCNPVMLQVSPVTAHRITMNGAHVIVSSHHRARETLQNDAESSRCDVEAAGLEPDTVRIRNPEMVVVEVGISNEVFAAPSIRFEAVGEIAKGSNRHLSIEPGIARGVNVFSSLKGWQQNYKRDLSLHCDNYFSRSE